MASSQTEQPAPATAPEAPPPATALAPTPAATPAATPDLSPEAITALIAEQQRSVAAQATAAGGNGERAAMTTPAPSAATAGSQPGGKPTQTLADRAVRKILPALDIDDQQAEALAQQLRQVIEAAARGDQPAPPARSTAAEAMPDQGDGKPPDPGGASLQAMAERLRELEGRIAAREGRDLRARVDAQIRTFHPAGTSDEQRRAAFGIVADLILRDLPATATDDDIGAKARSLAAGEFAFLFKPGAQPGGSQPVADYVPTDDDRAALTARQRAAAAILERHRPGWQR